MSDHEQHVSRDDRAQYVVAGALGLYVRYRTWQIDRAQYIYLIQSLDPATWYRYTGDDLYSGVQAAPDAAEALRVLAAMLADAGERYRRSMSAPDMRYPAWLYVEAYQYCDELHDVRYADIR